MPVAGLADLQHALVVRKDLGVGSVAELVALAKKDPGKLNYGSTGVGSGSHLTMELFKTRTGTAMTHVPFRGAAPMALEILAGRIDASFATLPSVLGQIQGGEMKALAIASTVRAPQLPDVPLLKEQGVAGCRGRQLARAVRAGRDARSRRRPIDQVGSRRASQARRARQRGQAGHRRQCARWRRVQAVSRGRNGQVDRRRQGRQRQGRRLICCLCRFRCRNR